MSVAFDPQAPTEPPPSVTHSLPNYHQDVAGNADCTILPYVPFCIVQGFGWLMLILEVISTTGIRPPSYGGRAQAYVTVQEVQSGIQLRSKLSTPSTGAQVWRETLIPITVSQSSFFVLKIYRRRSLFFLALNQLIATHRITMAELLEMGDNRPDDVVSVELAAHKGGKISVDFSFRVQNLTASAVIAQISPMAGEEGVLDKSGQASKTVSKIVGRLKILSGVARNLAELNPISAAAVTLVESMTKTLNLLADSNDKVRDLMGDVHHVLNFVESTELLPQMEQHATLILEILQCIMDCMQYTSGITHGALDMLSPGLSLRLERLEELQKTLKNLEFRMTQTLSVESALTTATIKTTVTNAVASTENARRLSELRPLSMGMMTAGHKRNICLPGTRANVIEELTKWGALLDSATPNVCWLFGPAGTGKSTLASSLAEIFTGFGYLGSFVFFDSDVSERAEPSAYIRTIAHDLASRDRAIADAVLAALEDNPKIVKMRLVHQFERLILEPLSATKAPARPVVIIIDALDEGGSLDLNSQKEFLSVLASGLPKLPKHVRVLITSRRDPHIVDYLSGLECVRQHDLSTESDVHNDIRTCITAQLSAVQRKNSTSLPSSWPEEHSVEHLVEEASGLFIWAVVACSFIDSSDDDPAIQLAQLLGNAISRGYAESPLDHLYAMAMAATNWSSPYSAAGRHNVLTAIIIARNPLTLQGIADLINMDHARVVKFVSGLHSVLTVDADGLIRVVHPSLRDYITNRARCRPDLAWSVDVETGNSVLAGQSLNLLGRRLQYNSMDLDTTVDFTWDSNKRRYIWVHRPYDGAPIVGYASTAWIDHVCAVQRHDLLPELYTRIVEFYSSHFLYWLEALSAMKHSRGAIRGLGKLHSWCQSHKETPFFDPHISELVHDSWRFVSSFSQTIEAHPLLVYDTALAFLPKRTVLYKVLSPQRLPEILLGSSNGWDSCLYTMNEDKAIIHSLAINPREKLLASTSSAITVRLWSWETGAETVSAFGLKGNIAHTMNITSSQFTPDGTLLLTASLDGRICGWDAKTGHLKDVLWEPDAFGLARATTRPEKRPSKIYSIAMLERDSLAVGRNDGAISIWNIRTLTRDETVLAGHADTVCSLHSADGNLMASGSKDTTVRLWNMHSRTLVRVYRGHTKTVHSVAIQPDLKHIASASADCTVRIWPLDREGDDECSVFVLEGHRGIVRTVAYSPDGGYLASGGGEDEIFVWATDGPYTLIHRFTSPTEDIYAVIFCDATTLVSGSETGELRVWTISKTAQDSPWVHRGPVTALAMSHRNNLFASAGDDYTVSLWHPKKVEGQPVWHSKIHKARINCMAFSPDDSLLATGSADRSVRFTETPIAKGSGSSNGGESVLSFPAEILWIAFSHCSHSKVAIGMDDNSIIVYNTVTQERTLELSCSAHGRLQAGAYAAGGNMIACLYCNENGTLGFMVWNGDTGDPLMQGNFSRHRTDDARMAALDYKTFHISFTAGADNSDSSLLVRYHYLWDNCLEVRVFDVATGREAPDAAEAALHRLFAMNGEIFHENKIIMPLPRDFSNSDSVCKWELAGDVIMLGMKSGRVYVVDFGPRFHPALES
ncbi:hypothetical protein C8R46DRAFT_1347799 [Mycena filopes]|nr:hypothetical protein C8R46DRAFT_1347799 [Mycena filopes]